MSTNARAAPTTNQEDYRFVVPSDLVLEVGVPAAFAMVVRPAEGYRVSTIGPLRIVLKSANADPLHLKKSRFTLGDATNSGSRAPSFEAKLTAQRAGTHGLTVKLHFWLCRAALCRPVHTEVILQLSARGAEPAGPDAGAPSASIERTERN